MEAKLAIIFNDFFSFGPGVLACATRGGGRSEAGHCFHLLFSFGPGVLACATRGGGRSKAGPCFHLLFSSSFFLIFARLLGTARDRSRSLDQPQVPGVLDETPFAFIKQFPIECK